MRRRHRLFECNRPHEQRCSGVKINSVSSYACHSSGRASRSPESPPSRWGSRARARRREAGRRCSARNGVDPEMAAGGTLEKGSFDAESGRDAVAHRRDACLRYRGWMVGGYDDRWIKHLRLLLIPHPPRLCASPITAARWWRSRRRPASLQSAEDLFRDKRHVTQLVDHEYCKVPQTAGCDLRLRASIIRLTQQAK